MPPPAASAHLGVTATLPRLLLVSHMHITLRFDLWRAAYLLLPPSWLAGALRTAEASRRRRAAQQLRVAVAAGTGLLMRRPPPSSVCMVVHW